MNAPASSRSVGHPLDPVVNRNLPVARSGKSSQSIERRYCSDRIKCNLLFSWELEPRVGVEPTTCRLRIGCSTTELPRPALLTIAFAEIFCQFSGEIRFPLPRKGVHGPADTNADQQEKEQRPNDIFHALDGLAAAQEAKRDRNQQCKQQHRL